MDKYEPLGLCRECGVRVAVMRALGICQSCHTRRRMLASFKPCPECGTPCSRYAQRCRGCHKRARGEQTYA
jgi:hypothetical protein